MDYRTATVETGVEIHYAVAGKPSDPCLVLIHGYPQTSYAFHKVIEPLASKGFFVVAPDYRGAGGSSVTAQGYDKWTMSRDIHTLYKQVLGHQKAVIIGYDIGSMVATALALQFRDDVYGLFASECPQPGTSVYEQVTTEDTWKYERVYHFFFHSAPDNWAEHLTVGKERFYIDSFYKRLTSKSDFLSKQDLDVYSRSFEGWDRMRAGFEVYRSFRQDREDVERNIAKNGKITLPTLASGGEHSSFTPLVEGMMRQLADNVVFKPIKNAGHWIAEEAPHEFVQVIVSWIRDDLAL